ncbi:MAG: hypothetical protein LBO78_04000 [Rickettsiales bacterium]|nr:hypothetical protein [Rickettsiales bacterium]
MKNFDKETAEKDSSPAEVGGGDAEGSASPPSSRPESIPEKFWDAAGGALKVPELLKSYAELERKLGALSRQKAAGGNVLDIALRTGGASEAYDIVLKHKALRVSDVLNERLKAAGFTNAQAQLVYDIGADVVVPAIEGMIGGILECRDLERLEEHFGGEERFDEIARQISLWAEKNLPEEIYSTLSSSYLGVIALYNMMGAGEPGVLGAGAASPEAPSEAKLRDMMRDPRYWRDGDKDFIRKVDDGFKTLYGGQ